MYDVEPFGDDVLLRFKIVNKMRNVRINSRYICREICGYHAKSTGSWFGSIHVVFHRDTCIASPNSMQKQLSLNSS